jgi:hypothetical protein
MISLVELKVANFAGWVRPPGERLTPYDDRMSFSDAVAIASAPTEYMLDERNDWLGVLREMFGAEAVEAEIARIGAESVEVSIVAEAATGRL